MRYFACKLSNEDIDALDDMMSRPEVRCESLNRWRERTSRTPTPMGTKQLEDLKDYTLNHPPKTDGATPPGWLSQFCWNGAYFGGCAFVVEREHCHTLFLVLGRNAEPIGRLFRAIGFAGSTG